MPPASRLSPEERALWARVAATVSPLAGRQVEPPIAAPKLPPVFADESRRLAKNAQPDPVFRRPPRSVPPSDTLDGGWDRRLRQGSVAPERTIDLHGHTLATAHAALEHALSRAVADDVRVLLVVTGKPPRGDGKRRGLIRASVGDWLAGSSFRDRIAAVRNAHPRHGGAGALYLILRRRRGG
jgi:DNA-nicking Smr family endonuclease